MATAIQPTTETLTDEQLASRFANDLASKALIELGDAAKASEVAKAVGRDDFEMQLARVALATNPNVTSTDRKWTLWSRFMDARSAFDTNVLRLLQTYGKPLRVSELAKELSFIYHRPAEVFESMLTRLCADGKRFVQLKSGALIPTAWFLKVEDEADEEVLFDNFLGDEEVYPYYDLADRVALSADPLTISAFLNEVGKPVKNLALQFLAWRRNKEEFSAYKFYSSAYTLSGAFPLSGGYWLGETLIERIVPHFAEIAKQEVVEAQEAEAAAQPLTIGDEDRERLIVAVLESDTTVFADKLLSQIFDITQDERTYEEDLTSVKEALKSDARVLWVGGNRFRPEGTIPAYVFRVPGLLEIPHYEFFNEDGDSIDLMLEDDGLDGGLDKEIRHPFAQDVLDEEAIPAPDSNPPSNVRAVIKYHHKMIGTLPLCQVPAGFFPVEPNILEGEFSLPGGQKAQIWINNETRLAYGLIDWFGSIPVDSGATFTLERISPDRYQVNYNDETEPSMFISRNRINELQELQERAETDRLPTFEILREIMEHYRKGIEFLTLHTEVNIVRRVNRRLIASLLSEYHCFFQRGGAWVYDAKKLTQGFDKSKRKYLKKS